MNMGSIAKNETIWGMSPVTFCRYNWTYLMKLFLLWKFADDENLLLWKLFTFGMKVKGDMELILPLHDLGPHTVHVQVHTGKGPFRLPYKTVWHQPCDKI